MIEKRFGGEDPGIVEQDINAAKTIYSSFDQAVGGCDLADIPRQTDNPFLPRADLCNGLLELLPVAAINDDICPIVIKGFGGHLADSGPAACDYNCFVLKTVLSII